MRFDLLYPIMHTLPQTFRNDPKIGSINYLVHHFPSGVLQIELRRKIWI